jgi:N utilization substance protein B
MKTAQDPRHVRRIKQMQSLFSYSFRSRSTKSIAPIVEELSSIDEKIVQAAPEWPIDKISKIDLSILRLSIWELAFGKKEPPKVVIDEAVELAKSFGNEHSAKFINGVLGTVMKSL